MLYKYCRCGVKIEQHIKACDKCLVVMNNERKNRYKKYQSTRNDTDSQKFYNSRAWKKTRDRIKSRDNNLCLYCLFINKKIRGMDLVHHIKEEKEFVKLKLDETNLISLCEKCHRYIHKAYEVNNKSKKEMQKILQELLERDVEI